MAKGKEQNTVPKIIQGRSFIGPSSLEEIVLCMLESAIKNNAQNAAEQGI